MNNEENRLSTYSTWPLLAAVIPPSPYCLAKQGFFYTGTEYEVECFSCGDRLSRWNNGDNAMELHRQKNPLCPFLVDPENSGNIPFNLDPPSNEVDFYSHSPRIGDYPQPNDIDGRPTLNSNDEFYRNDALRILSFINWPVRFISRESLVAAGFYHAGGGRVRCAWCGGELSGGWRRGDRPLEEHRRHFPSCEYARAASNPPQSEYPPARFSLFQRLAAPQTEAFQHNSRVLDTMSWRTLGVVACSSDAKHPARASYSSRIASFYSWPSNMNQTPEMLAEAGFFYTGSDDQVICFFCGGGLGRWEATDVPWREHARWFPDCAYVMLVLGGDTRSRPDDSQNPVTNGNTQRTTDTGNNSFAPVPITDAQVDAEMETPVSIAALGTGLGVTRIRTAIRRRLRSTGSGFTSAEALIDAALNEQLNEQAWSANPRPANARDILAETLRTLRTAAQDTWNNQSSLTEEQSPQDSLTTSQEAPTTATDNPGGAPENPTEAFDNPNGVSDNPSGVNNDPNEASNSSGNQEALSGVNETPQEIQVQESPPELPSGEEESNAKTMLSLEEENRRLREARICKVCMDSDVSAVLLPCGHAVSCSCCAASLASCPLCRRPVRAIIKAYLA